LELHFLIRFLAATAIIVLAVSAKHWQTRAVKAERRLGRASREGFRMP